MRLVNLEGVSGKNHTRPVETAIRTGRGRSSPGPEFRWVARCLRRSVQRRSGKEAVIGRQFARGPPLRSGKQNAPIDICRPPPRAAENADGLPFRLLTQVTLA